VLASTACGRGPGGSNGSGDRIINGAQLGDDSLYYLDLKKTSIQQSIDLRNTAPPGPKFVQIEVTQVTNPNKHPLVFEVRYKSKSNVATLLGSFTLYPPDNPGKFIVATQGKLKDEGQIILTLVTPNHTDRREPIRVAVKRISYR
jgi:hypothetical protein